MFIYLIVNSVTGKYYVGQHKGDNLKKYLQTKLSQATYELKRKGHGRGSILFASMRKHPKEAWSIHPLVSTITTKTELDHWERFFIAMFKCRDRNHGYNICRGGEGFTGPHSEESRNKMSIRLKVDYEKGTRTPASSLKDPVVQALRIQKQKEYLITRVMTQAQRDSIDQTGRKWTPEQKAKMVGNKNSLGHVVSEETRVKLRTPNDGHFAKGLAPWNKGKRKRSPEEQREMARLRMMKHRAKERHK